MNTASDFTSGDPKKLILGFFFPLLLTNSLQHLSHTLLLCDSWLKGKKAFGEQMQGDVTKKNKISFDGTVQMNIMPQKQDWSIDGNSLKMEIPEHSIAVVKICK